MKTYINPQTKVIALQSTTMNCEITSIGGAFKLGSNASSENQV